MNIVKNPINLLQVTWRIQNNMSTTVSQYSQSQPSV